MTVSLDSGRLERRLTDKVSVTGLCAAPGHIAVVSATDSTAPELHALEGTQLRQLTSHNDAVMSELSLGAVQDISFASRDGAEVHGMLVSRWATSHRRAIRPSCGFTAGPTDRTRMD